MGMFDTISCKVKGWFFENAQTKSFQREMSHYEIAEDGTLWKKSTSDHGMDVTPTNEQILYTGEIKMICNFINGHYKLHDFIATMINGKLTSIKQINPVFHKRKTPKFLRKKKKN